jgi:putative dimethyl sulfoxide reductase chaperone
MNQAAENISTDQKTDEGAGGIFQTGALQTEQEIQNAARSNMYALMADVFRYPDQAFRNFVRNGELVEGLNDIVPNLPFEYSITEQEKGVLRFSDKISDDEVEAEFIRLFEAGPGDPPCSLVEGKQVKGSNRRTIFEDLIRFYNNFGLSYQEGSMEDRPDHISYELEFMHYLAFLTIKALQDNKETNGFLQAQKDFLEHHLNRWASLLAGKLKSIIEEIASPDEAVLFYSCLLQLLDRFVTADFTYLKKILAD